MESDRKMTNQLEIVLLISAAVSNSLPLYVHLRVCASYKVGTLSTRSLFRFPLWMRVNCVLALQSILMDLLRFASSVYRIFPRESLKEDGRSLQDMTTQCTKETG